MGEIQKNTKGDGKGKVGGNDGDVTVNVNPISGRSGEKEGERRKQSTFIGGGKRFSLLPTIKKKYNEMDEDDEF